MGFNTQRTLAFSSVTRAMRRSADALQVRPDLGS
jgi:hypothetical protein